MALPQIRRKLNVQGCFRSLADQFPIAETGVAITQEEVGPGS